MGLAATLAADSMEGRLAGSEGERRARDVLVHELERYGVRPGGEHGYLQRVPLRMQAIARSAPDAHGYNVIGMIRGSDSILASQVVVVSAHYDHLGFGEPVHGDSVHNGADDNASGVVAVLEIARSLSTSTPPARTVVVALFTAEESGLLGSRWFVDHPTVPLTSVVAALQIEMIGRPDAAVGGPGRGWLTGYDRSSVADVVERLDVGIAPDPRPERQFFRRSDNFPFALAGIPAHTVSSFGIHDDYHAPSDEVTRLDPVHMVALVDAAEAIVRQLASGPAPTWREGRRPTLYEGG